MLQPAENLPLAEDSFCPQGLSQTEALSRLQQLGPNEPVAVRRRNAISQFFHFATNPLVLILLVASALSALLGQTVDAILIAAIVALSVILNFVQAFRSERAVLALREQVAPTTTVLRDGKWVELLRRELVPGDVIRLTAGDLVPADAHLLSSQDLHVQQAALTGESMPADKKASTDSTAPASPERSDLVFLGTTVMTGSAVAEVTATGPRTMFGDIAARLAERPPETEFDRGTRQFGILIMRTVFFLVLFILMVSLALHRNAFESLLFAVSLAVGLTPEFLPMITTVTLSMGALRMAANRVIVKHLDAIENLGSIDVLCSDKTGTLTSGAMTLEGSLDPRGRNSDRALVLAYINSSMETGIKSPLDQAILATPDVRAGEYQKCDELPFDFERRRLSVIASAHGTILLITKGAPEEVIGVSSFAEIDGNRVELDQVGRRRYLEVFRDLSARGLRVLGVGWRKVDHAEGVTVADERDLTFAGFLTFVDPALEGVSETVAALRNDGVRLMVLTGDNELVARHVCHQVGIGCDEIILGEELARTTDNALAHLVEDVNVFARVSPAQKNRIIRALKARGHVIGFLGDGINDAPSLHAADVGISVSGAVEVARDAADIILLERGLSVLHRGIVEGRKAFGNVLKYILMGTSSNFGNMFSMAVASVFLPYLPMLPTQILLNNFLYDLAQVTIPTDNVDPAYVQSPQRWNVSVIRNFMVLIGPISSIFDFVTFFVLLRILHAPQELFHTGWFVESLATQTLVLFVIRTAGRPWTNLPSKPLALTTLLIVALGVALPFVPFSARLGFVALPGNYFLFLAFATITYLALVELVKQMLLRSFLPRTERDAG